MHDYFAHRNPTAQEFGQFTQATIDFSTAMADEVGNAAQSIAPVALADVIQQMQQHAAYGRRAGALEVLLQVAATYMAWPGVHPSGWSTKQHDESFPSYSLWRDRHKTLNAQPLQPKPH